METIEVLIKNDSDIFEIVKGSIFHITPWYNTEGILKSGAINNNSQKKYKSPWRVGSNGYYRERKCVSFFDYRYYDSPEFKDNEFKCNLTKFLCPDSHKSSIFILSEYEYPKLKTWDDVKDAGCGYIIVPYIEAGYPFHVDLSVIDTHFIVEMHESYFTNDWFV